MVHNGIYLQNTVFLICHVTFLGSCKWRTLSNTLCSDHISPWEQGELICSRLISRQSTEPIVTYTIGDWLKMKPRTTERSLLLMRYNIKLAQWGKRSLLINRFHLYVTVLKNMKSSLPIISSTVPHLLLLINT